MKALAIRRYQAPMELMELPRPEPGPGELLVRVRAAGVNPLDFKIRDGAVKALLSFSFPPILGTPQAREALRRALELAGDEGWIRVFVDLGEPMRNLLVRERGAGGDVVERLLAAFGGAPLAATTAVAPLAEPIRERELDVLRCIDAGMSNSEIAAHLYLSLNTVKTHVRNLYGKLGVENRIQALRRSRELGLISG